MGDVRFDRVRAGGSDLPNNQSGGGADAFSRTKGIWRDLRHGEGLVSGEGSRETKRRAKHGWREQREERHDEQRRCNAKSGSGARGRLALWG